MALETGISDCHKTFMTSFCSTFAEDEHFTRYSSLFTCYSLLVTFYWLLVTFYWLLVTFTRYSVTRYSFVQYCTIITMFTLNYTSVPEKENTSPNGCFSSVCQYYNVCLTHRKNKSFSYGSEAPAKLQA